MTYSASFIDWFAGEAVRNYGDVIPSSVKGVTNLVIKQPVGVVGIVTPWNFPLAMITRKAGAAIAAGCTMVLKAPAETPYTVGAGGEGLTQSEGLTKIALAGARHRGADEGGRRARRCDVDYLDRQARERRGQGAVREPAHQEDLSHRIGQSTLFHNNLLQVADEFP